MAPLPTRSSFITLFSVITLFTFGLPFALAKETVSAAVPAVAAEDQVGDCVGITDIKLPKVAPGTITLEWGCDSGSAAYLRVTDELGEKEFYAGLAKPGIVVQKLIPGSSYVAALKGPKDSASARLCVPGDCVVSATEIARSATDSELDLKCESGSSVCVAVFKGDNNEFVGFRLMKESGKVEGELDEKEQYRFEVYGDNTRQGTAPSSAAFVASADNKVERLDIDSIPPVVTSDQVAEGDCVGIDKLRFAEVSPYKMMLEWDCKSGATAHLNVTDESGKQQFFAGVTKSGVVIEKLTAGWSYAVSLKGQQDAKSYQLCVPGDCVLDTCDAGRSGADSKVSFSCKAGTSVCVAAFTAEKNDFVGFQILEQPGLLNFALDPEQPYRFQVYGDNTQSGAIASTNGLVAGVDGSVKPVDIDSIPPIVETIVLGGAGDCVGIDKLRFEKVSPTAMVLNWDCESGTSANLQVTDEAGNLVVFSDLAKSGVLVDKLTAGSSYAVAVKGLKDSKSYHLCVPGDCVLSSVEAGRSGSVSKVGYGCEAGKSVCVAVFNDKTSDLVGMQRLVQASHLNFYLDPNLQYRIQVYGDITLNGKIPMAAEFIAVIDGTIRPTDVALTPPIVEGDAVLQGTEDPIRVSPFDIVGHQGSGCKDTVLYQFSVDTLNTCIKPGKGVPPSKFICDRQILIWQADQAEGSADKTCETTSGNFTGFTEWGSTATSLERCRDVNSGVSWNLEYNPCASPMPPVPTPTSRAEPTPTPKSKFTERAEPTKRAEQTKVVPTTGPTPTIRSKFTEPAKPTETAEPTQAAEPTKLAEPTEVDPPTEPTVTRKPKFTRTAAPTDTPEPTPTRESKFTAPADPSPTPVVTRRLGGPGPGGNALPTPTPTPVGRGHNSVYSSNLGDPHVTTLDGITVTYVGCGDHVMLADATEADGFVYQARSCERGNVAASTCAIAFKCGKNAPVVELYSDDDGATMFVDGAKWTSPVSSEVSLRHIKISRAKDMYRFACANGISFTAKLQNAATFKYLDVFVGVPTTFMGRTKGLMGNFDGDRENDVAHADGTVWREGHGLEYVNALEHPDIDPLQQSWEVQPAASLFHLSMEASKATCSLSAAAQRRHAQATADDALCSTSRVFCAQFNLAPVAAHMCEFDFVSSGGDRMFASNTAAEAAKAPGQAA